MGRCPDHSLYSPLYLHRRWRDLGDSGNDHGHHFLPLHPIQSGKKPSPPPCSGGLFHPHLLTPFPFRCLLSTLFPRCPFNSLSGATNSQRVKTRRDSYSHKNLMEADDLEIYEDLFSCHRSSHFGNCTL